MPRTGIWRIGETFAASGPKGQAATDDTRFPRWMLDHVDRSLPSPQERVAVVEEVDRLLGLLDDPLRQIVLWRIEGFTTEEISCMIGKRVRSVEYKLNLVRRLLEQEIGPANTRINPAPAGGHARVDMGWAVCGQAGGDRPYRSGCDAHVSVSVL